MTPVRRLVRHAPPPHPARLLPGLLVLLVLVATLGASSLPAQQMPATPAAHATSTAERQLFAVEDAWARALVRRDAAAFRRLIAPRWTYADEHGFTGRDQAIADYTTGSDTVTAAHNEEMHAQVYGDAAVVTGILVTEGRGAGGPFRHRYRFTDTWLRRNGRWSCIASQDYDIPR